MTELLTAIAGSECPGVLDGILEDAFQQSGFALTYKRNISALMFEADFESTDLVILYGSFADCAYCQRLRDSGFVGHILVVTVQDDKDFKEFLSSGADEVCSADPVELARRASVLNRAIKKVSATVSVASKPALEQSQRLQSILDAQVDLTSRYSRGGHLTFVNDAICQKFGLKKEELLGQSIVEFVPAQDRPNLAAAVEAIFKDAEPFMSIQKSRDSFGQVSWTEWYNIPIIDQSGVVIECQGIGRDVTERVELAEQLKAREEHLRLALVASGTVSWSLTVESRLLEVSENAIELLGCIPESLEHLMELVYVGDRAGLREFLARAVEESDERKLRVRIIHPASGAARWIEICCAPVREHSGSIWKLCGILFDVADRVQAEEDLTEKGRRFEELAKTRSMEVSELQQRLDIAERFASMGMIAARVAHELNGPIAGVRNAFYLIRDILNPNHPYYEYADMIERELDRLTQILRQLFVLYGPEGHTPGNVSIRALLEESCKMVHVIFLRKASPIQLNVPPEMPDFEMVPGAVRQVFYNILINALKFSPRDQAVEVDVRFTAPHLFVEVRNGGASIPLDMQAELFKPFCAKAQNTSELGMGLGLYISRCLMTEMGGDISLRSENNSGTVVTLKFVVGSGKPVEELVHVRNDQLQPRSGGRR